MEFDPFSSEAIEDPYEQYARPRADVPIGWHDRMCTWLIFGYDDVREFFKNDETLTVDRSTATKYRPSATAPKSAPTRNIQQLDPPDHTPIRQMLTRSPTPRVRSFGPNVEHNHITFGLGTHYCPGAGLTRLEGRLALPALLHRFPNLRLADEPHTWRQTFVLRGLEHLPVRVD